MSVAPVANGANWPLMSHSDAGHSDAGIVVVTGKAFKFTTCTLSSPLVPLSWVIIMAPFECFNHFSTVSLTFEFLSGQYLSLDTDHNGMLSKQELLRYADVLE